MASKYYSNFLELLLKGDIDLDEAGNDIRVALVMTNTTVDTETDKALMNAFTTLDEFDGSAYVRKALTQTVSENAGSNRGVFDASDVAWTALGAGTRSVQGALVYKHVTNDTDSIPLFYLELTAPIPMNGGDFTLQWDSAGLIYLGA